MLQVLLMILNVTRHFTRYRDTLHHQVLPNEWQLQGLYTHLPSTHYNLKLAVCTNLKPNRYWVLIPALALAQV